MKTQTIKHDKYIAVTMYRRREKQERLKSQLKTFFFCLFLGCGALYLAISSLPY